MQPIVLIIEDTEEIITTYNDIIETSFPNIITFICRSLEEGLIALDQNTFDGAIVDLRLGQGDQEGQGNILLKKILEMQRFPVCIVSGHLQDLDPDLVSRSEFIKQYKKTDDLHLVFQDVINIYKTGLTRVIGKKGMIEKYIDNIFWNHLSKNIPYWVNKSNDVDTEKYLLRYTLSHLQEYLDLTDTQDGFDRYLDIECYIYPSVKVNLFTGDIIHYNDKPYIILSPSCDLAQRKAKLISLAEIEDIEMQLVRDYKHKISTGTEDQKQTASIELARLYRNSLSSKYHFLPSTPFFRGGFVNFQKLISVRANDIDNQVRLLSVSSNFTKDITSRFSQYYARQGQPDINLDHLAL
jgi:hypothetical protein